MKNSIVDQYNHFIGTQYNVIREYLDTVHDCYIKRNSLFKQIEKHKPYLIMIGFPYAKLEIIQREDNVKAINLEYEFDDDPKSLILKSNIQYYVHLSCIRIPDLKLKIEFHQFLLSIKFKNFTDIYSTLNTEIANKIIEGGMYVLPNSKGAYIEIKRFARNFKKNIVNWGESNKLKKINPDRYIVYHIDDEYVAPRFGKKNCVYPNYKLYRFKFTSFINGVNRKIEELYPKLNTVEKILQCTKLGNFQKMLAMTKLHGMDYYDKLIRQYDL